ncbi:MAG: ATP synthase F1 subunit gamma [Eubacteriales bacterium]
MAGVSMKDIKLRIRSMQSTKQITKAMEMVATSKLRGAQNRMNKSRAYGEILKSTMQDIASAGGMKNSTYLAEKPIEKACYIVIAGDRGLAGGYNNNVFKDLVAHMGDAPAKILPMGKKAVEFCRSKGLETLSTAYNVAADLSPSHCYTIANALSKGFLEGEYDAVYLCYTEFVSMMVQEPRTIQLLPVPKMEAVQKGKGLTIYEPSPEAVLASIIPEYLGGVVYSNLCQSIASELGARRTAMDAATKNAEEMIDSFSLQYNRARQGAITQEITEIVAGSNA